MRSKTLNMTEGSPVRLLIVFAIPMLIGNLFQQFYNLVDSIVVGKYVGAEALAAVGATGSVSFLFFALCNGVGSGGGIITAKQFGAGNEEEVKKTIVNSGYILFAGSLVVGLIAFMLAGPLLRFMATPENILQDATLYMRMQCLGLPLVAVYNHSSSMLRALGDSKSPLYFLVFACLLNVGLDVWFVYGFGMGVFGAALATMIAQLTAGASCLFYAVKSNPYFKLEKRHFKPIKSIIWETVRLGVPLSLQFALVAISCMALQRVVNSYGSVVVAAFTAADRVEQLLHQPYGTLSAALATYCGQNLGAGKMERIKQGFKKSVIMMLIFSMIMLPIMQFGGEWIVSLFVDDPEVIRYGAAALKITSLFYVFLGTINVARGVLNGVGDAIFALINGIVEVAGRVVFPVILVAIPMVGVWGIWWSAGLVWFFSALSCVWRYISWRKKNIPARELPSNS
ncbi:MAG: MATE family efflux transporter [Lachnospiraceae bacterium]|nr:MATE family efflux transporter [Lachnospiraceae bacterium]